jgi:mitochondrial fission protein ELM1
MITWALLDERVGSNKQTLAIADGISGDFAVKNIKYNVFVKLPNFILSRHLCGMNKRKSDDIFVNLPDLIICSGRRLANVALNIKKRNKNKTKIITILNPNFNFNKFDVVILPEHDNKIGKNVITYTGSLVNLDKNKKQNEVEKWKNTFSQYKKPFVSFFMGGDTKKTKFRPENLKNILNIKETLLISTSRRTGKKCVEMIEKKQVIEISDNENLKFTNFLYNWNREYGQNNPYFAMLGVADYIIVTGDSISMVAESCGTGKPVFIYMPKKSLSKKHYNFCKQMVEKGYAKEWEGKLIDYEYRPLNELDVVIKKIKEIL